jgi:hypothetical protein
MGPGWARAGGEGVGEGWEAVPEAQVQTLGADCTVTARTRRAAHVQQRRNPPAIKAEQNGEQKGRSQAEGVGMGKLGAKAKERIRGSRHGKVRRKGEGKDQRELAWES